MANTSLPVGCFVMIEKPDLQAIIDRLASLGYRVLGPQVRDRAIVLDDLDRFEQLPAGFIDEQQPGRYRLVTDDGQMVFAHVVGPQSLKTHLFPSRVAMLEARLEAGTWQFRAPEPQVRPLAVVGVRGCDLKALELQDRAFLGGRFRNHDYAARRKDLFVLAVNCARAAETCFCTSMGTGPAVQEGFDLALTEMPDHYVLEVGTERGGEVAAAAPWSPCSIQEVAAAQAVPRRTAETIEARKKSNGTPSGRHLDTSGLHDALLDDLESPRYDEVAERCLACGNCTMVCPSCFCSTVQDTSDLSGHDVRRDRVWESCFNAEHSYMNSGTVRRSIRARYRQWLTHKLASWIDQFGASGCTGCGRCITWCPVGIDLTQEAAAVRGGVS